MVDFRMDNWIELTEWLVGSSQMIKYLLADINAIFKNCSFLISFYFAKLPL